MTESIKLSDLDGRRVVVWGAGREGHAAVELIAGRCHPATLEVVDDADGSQDPTALLTEAEVIVKSPGISRYRTELGDAVARGAGVTSGTALWMAETEGHSVLAISGTKGKSTTASLVAHLLRTTGRSIELAGNIGRPVVELFGSDATEFVLELSSFQIADLTDSPDVGVITTLFPEHLDWHGTYDNYVSDKFNLFAHRDDTQAVLCAENANVVEAAGRLEIRNINWFGESGRFWVRDDFVLRNDDKLFGWTDLQLPGRHNALNVCAALQAIECFGVDVVGQLDLVTSALRAFQPLSHRLHTVATRRGVTYVDDGLSTNPHATIAAIAAYRDRPLTLLLGGHDRGVDYTPLGVALANSPGSIRVLFMPDNGPRIRASVESQMSADSRLTLVDVSSLDEAIRDAADNTPAGGVVLLSPGAASFGQFEDYRARSAAFVAAVAALGE